MTLLNTGHDVLCVFTVYCILHKTLLIDLDFSRLYLAALLWLPYCSFRSQVCTICVVEQWSVSIMVNISTYYAPLLHNNSYMVVQMYRRTGSSPHVTIKWAIHCNIFVQCQNVHFVQYSVLAQLCYRSEGDGRPGIAVELQVEEFIMQMW